ncbi:MAG: Queuine tRNA-ribosyltransferase [Alphaproteobacteria bacterium MarineAlpha6_Bin3]|nr:MAG: Queuine tRNA-ribosyltransferase [Alphaproteobacteria bacterium MarineAlpha6_Bin3]|tara:strand:- start:10809 stop:11924 length:1116 start_codon:yes stop_codon:yes gene_type:complete
MKKKFAFKKIKNFESARLGRITTSKGIINTPAFMPVGTIANVKAMFPENVIQTNSQVILCNTYHLMLRPGEKIIKKFKGIHKFMNCKLPILTDSGGYQIWSLAKLKKVKEKGIKFRSHIDGELLYLTPENCIKFQQNIGSDIIMVLDECTDYNIPKKKAEISLNLTLRWAKRCKKAFNKKDSALFGIVQGAKYEDLRIKCAESLQQIGFDGYAVGGLSVGEDQNEMLRILNKTVPFLPDDKPKYLMGVGMPSDIIKSVAHGIDMFDCVLPTRLGRNGLAFTTSGIINIKNAKFKKDETMLDKNLDCPASNNYSKAYVHHLFKSNEILGLMILSWNNVFYYQNFMSRIRDSIRNNKFDKFYKNYFKYESKRI